jgi:hypothetical protein
VSTHTPAGLLPPEILSWSRSRNGQSAKKKSIVRGKVASVSTGHLGSTDIEYGLEQDFLWHERLLGGIIILLS